jgi:hypothetical protein
MMDLATIMCCVTAASAVSSAALAYAALRPPKPPRGTRLAGPAALPRADRPKTAD